MDIRKSVATGACAAISLVGIGGGAALMGEGFKSIGTPDEESSISGQNFHDGLYTAVGGEIVMLAGVAGVVRFVSPHGKNQQD